MIGWVVQFIEDSCIENESVRVTPYFFANSIEILNFGVASFGMRPMFEVQTPLFETWLFEFAGDLYGKHLAVELVAYLRPEAMFADVDALKSQIANDAEAARKALAATAY